MKQPIIGEIADENMRKAIECACEIYDMVFA